MSKKKLLQESKTKNWEEYFTMYFYSLFLSRLFCVSSVVCVFFPSTFIVVNTKQGDVLHQQAVPIVCICVREQLPLRSPILWRLTGISQATEELFIAPVKIERSWLSVTVPEQMKSFQWTVDTSTGFLRFFIRNHRCLFFGSSCWAFLQFFH